MQINLSFLFLLVTSLTFISCSDIDSPQMIPAGTGSGVNETPEPLDYDLGSSVNGNIMGVVLDKRTNNPIPYAQIKIKDQIFTTSALGDFTLNNVNLNQKRSVLTFSKENYFDEIRTFVPDELDNTPFFTILLTEQLLSEPINDVNRGLFTDGGWVKFPENSLINEDGSIANSIQAYGRAIRADDEQFLNQIPGSDLLGVDEDMNEFLLYSYGMLEVKLPDGVKLAAGTTAKMHFFNSLKDTENTPLEVPMWYLDESTGIWVQEGMATLSEDGSNYVGEVSHFTTWNVDSPEDEPATLCINVECGGAPVSNINIYASQYSGQTDASGNACMEVRPNVPIDIGAFFGQVGDYENEPYIVPPLSSGQTVQVDATMDGYGVVTAQLIGCDGLSLNSAIKVSAGSAGSFYAAPVDNGNDVEIGVPANTSFTILYTVNDEQRIIGPYTVDNCGVLDIGTINFCEDIEPSGYTFTIEAAELPLLDGKVISRETTTDATKFVCTGFKEFSFDEAPNQYAQLVQTFVTYQDGILDSEKSSFWPCLEEGMFFQMIRNGEWELEDDFLEPLGLIKIQFASVDGTLELDESNSDYDIINYDVTMKVSAFGSEADTYNDQLINVKGFIRI